MPFPVEPERPSVVELKRRRVFRVASVYIVAGFAFLEYLSAATCHIVLDEREEAIRVLTLGVDGKADRCPAS